MSVALTMDNLDHLANFEVKQCLEKKKKKAYTTFETLGVGMTFLFFLKEVSPRLNLFKNTVKTEMLWNNITILSLKARNCDHFGHICSHNLICATSKYI